MIINNYNNAMKKLLLISFVVFTQINLFSADFVVKMLNQSSSGVMVFEPAVLEIEVGDTVTFQSTDAAHNSASIPGMIPDGASAWNGQLSRDTIVTFDIPGIYGYQCTPHAMMAMVGVIKVGGDSSNKDSVQAAAKLYKSTFVMNQTRLDDYLSKI